MNRMMIEPTGAPYVYRAATAWDTETHMMSEGNLIPQLVCMALNAGPDLTQVWSTVENDKLLLDVGYLMDVIERKDEVIVAANAAFDLAVLARHVPEALPHIFKLLQGGYVEDIFIREKLLHLSTHGNLEYCAMYNQEGEVVANIKLEFNLGALSQRYLGKSRQHDKEESDAWRTFYKELEGVPIANWPVDAIRYVSEDAEDTWHIREIQERERLKVIEKVGIDPFKTQGFRVAAAFALHLMGAWGMGVDPVAKAKIDAMLLEELRPEKMKLLISTGILRPAEPPRPHARGAKNADGTPKMTAGKEESVNKKILQEYVRQFCEARKIDLKKTEPTEKFPEGQISTASEFFEDHQHDDPVFKEYYDRQVLQKLVSTEMPRMCRADGSPAQIVHPGYDVLKRTGRTSSFASKKWPSYNCQNIDPRVRGCYVPRSGFLFFSVDYNQMELGTAAQKCFDLFKYSVMKDKINAGVDVHTYLGAQIAFNLHQEFNTSVIESATAGVTVDAEFIYQSFAKCSKHDSEEVRNFFKHYRKFAKPTGLGYPGGLGAETFIQYAKATYGVEVDKQMAEKLRDIWRATFPEFVDYFKWINTCCGDVCNPDKFAYSSPFGMYRAGADYCATANGAALQTPSAEGAILSVFNIICACFDNTLGSILGDDSKGPVVRPIAFVHDEVIGEIRNDDLSYAGRKLRHERAYEIGNIMVNGMRVVTPDVTPRANPVLMERWDKNAEPVFDSDGFLDVWRPKVK